MFLSLVCLVTCQDYDCSRTHSCNISLAQERYWLKQHASKFDVRYPELRVAGASEKLQAHVCRSTRLDGGLVWWELRAVQACLRLQLSQDYTSKWLMTNFKRWQAFLHDHRMPSTQLVASRKATKTSGVAKGHEDSPQFDHYAAGTCALLLLLMKWAMELKGGASRLAARELLTCILMEALPTCQLTILLQAGTLQIDDVDNDSLWPSATGDLTILLEDGKLDISDALGAWGTFASAYSRTGRGREL